LVNFMHLINAQNMERTKLNRATFYGE